MAAMSHTLLSIAFLWMKMLEFRINFVPKGPIKNIPALVQIMAWWRPGDKPLSEPMVGNLLTYICVTRPQWVQSEFDILGRIIWCLNAICSVNSETGVCLISFRCIEMKYWSSDCGFDPVCKMQEDKMYRHYTLAPSMWTHNLALGDCEAEFLNKNGAGVCQYRWLSASPM